MPDTTDFDAQMRKIRSNGDNAQLLVRNPGAVCQRGDSLFSCIPDNQLGISADLEPEQYRIFDLFAEIGLGACV